MTKSKDIQQNDDLIETSNDRRKFLEKFGKLAVVTPLAVTALMSPTTSAAPKSGCNKNGRNCK
ncbi:hypothetical protein AADZ91_04440 [Colwelliaceae bacterium 6441]